MAADEPADQAPRPAGDGGGRLEQAWQRLAKADEIVQGFGERGWITDASMTEVDDRTREVARRVGRAQQHSGDDDPLALEPQSAALVHEVEQLTALLVALADEAITRQPSLAPDTPVPVSLDDARRRLTDP